MRVIEKDRSGQISHRALRPERSLSREKEEPEKQLTVSLLTDPPTLSSCEAGSRPLKVEGGSQRGKWRVRDRTIGDWLQGCQFVCEAASEIREMLLCCLFQSK